ncbi:hypothetical protein Adt_28031 [Abeliophyllum distichum]|uniref:Uncharacterized protein n=1 Tax=Abeliophyllum distichum TaxID=126358 RepID=A0ABD1RVS0_9LAMI
MAKYYNSKVKKRSFHVNDFVLNKVFQANREVGSGTLGPLGNDLTRLSKRFGLEPIDWMIQREVRRGILGISLIYAHIISSFSLHFFIFQHSFQPCSGAVLF